MTKLRALLYLSIVASLFVGLTQGAQALTAVETHVSKSSVDLSVEQRAVRCRHMYGDQSFPIRRGNGTWECIGGAMKPR